VEVAVAVAAELARLLAQQEVLADHSSAQNMQWIAAIQTEQT
jgi:hypothetical protein